MVKNVTVTVVGEQRTSREENNGEPIELVTRGSLHEKDGVFYLKYDEYYEDLEKPARNLLKFDKLGLDLTKKGEVSAAMSFRPGETREAFYYSHLFLTVMVGQSKLTARRYSRIRW